MSNLSDQPRLLKGAFVEYGLSVPPMMVVFQFNPETISRSRSNTYSVPAESIKAVGNVSMREYHQMFTDLDTLQDLQEVKTGSETISFDVRLDATQNADSNNPANKLFGIAPQLSTLELMMYPKSESILGKMLDKKGGFSFTGKDKPPLILFVWGRKKVLPVNIESMKINEQEFSPDLNPVRATVSVELNVIEGPNLPYEYSKGMKEAMSVLNLTNLTNVSNVIIP